MGTFKCLSGASARRAWLTAALLVMAPLGTAYAQTDPCAATTPNNASGLGAAGARAQSALYTLQDLLGHSQAPCIRTASTAGGPPVSGAPPWSPGAAAAPVPAAAGTAVPIRPAQLPDVGGLHVGISREEATNLIRGMHGGRMSTTPMGREPATGLRSSWQSGEPNNNESLEIGLTMPPAAPQLVYFVTRGTSYPQMLSHASAIAALREKYGRETLAIAGGGPARPGDDTGIGNMYWLFDESGKLVPPGSVSNQLPYGCAGLADNQYTSLVSDYVYKRMPPPGFCESVIVINAAFAPGDMTRSLTVTMVDNALMLRAVRATGDYQTQQATQQHDRQLQQSGQTKPSL
ncbi:MAG: hypothetical protein JSS29_07635 [Proteobacteria bacterium]|nr:hypothetical protein [Pseudomonadota bacterium]